MSLSWWFVTQYGSYSIVQMAEDTYCVRARIRQDLANLIELLDLDSGITDCPQEGYRYRVMVDLDELLEIMVQLACAIDYPSCIASRFQRDSQTE